MSILEELYSSDMIHIREPKTAEYQQARQQESERIQALEQQLNPEQRRMLDNCVSAVNAVGATYEKEAFVQGVRFGVLLYRDLTGPDNLIIL